MINTHECIHFTQAFNFQRINERKKFEIYIHMIIIQLKVTSIFTLQIPFPFVPVFLIGSKWPNGHAFHFAIIIAHTGIDTELIRFANVFMTRYSSSIYRNSKLCYRQRKMEHTKFKITQNRTESMKSLLAADMVVNDFGGSNHHQIN